MPYIEDEKLQQFIAEVKERYGDAYAACAQFGGNWLIVVPATNVETAKIGSEIVAIGSTCDEAWAKAAYAVQRERGPAVKVTFTGPAGSGKTWLCAHIQHMLHNIGMNVRGPMEGDDFLTAYKVPETLRKVMEGK